MDLLYKNILFSPIDIPLDNSLTEFANNFQSEFEFANWDVMKLTNDSTNYAVADFKEYFKDSHSNMLDYFYREFPFTEFINVKLHRAKSGKLTRPHSDLVNPAVNPVLTRHLIENEPCGYRMILKGDSSKLYIINSKGNKQYCSFPENCNAFLIRHTDGIHGADADDNRLALFLSGIIDDKKHNRILARSLAKFKNYVIYDEK